MRREELTIPLTGSENSPARLPFATFFTFEEIMRAPGGPNGDPSGNFPHGGWLVPHGVPIG